MAESVTVSLGDIRQRREALQRELEELQAVERFIRRQAGEALLDGRFAPTPSNGAKSGPTMVGLIREFVREKGPVASSEVVRHVHKTLPKAQASSIRSTCSVLRRKGEFRRVGEKWTIIAVEGRSKETAASDN